MKASTDIFLKIKKNQRWCARRITCFVLLAITAASDALCTLNSSEYSSCSNIDCMPYDVIERIVENLSLKDTASLRITSKKLAKALTPYQVDLFIKGYLKKWYISILAGYDKTERSFNEYDSKNNCCVDVRNIIPPDIPHSALDNLENSVLPNSPSDDLSASNENFSFFQTFKKKALALNNLNEQTLDEKSLRIKKMKKWVVLRLLYQQEKLFLFCAHDIKAKNIKPFQISNDKLLFYGHLYAPGAEIFDLTAPDIAKKIDKLNQKLSLKCIFLNLEDGRLLISDSTCKKTEIITLNQPDQERSSTVLRESIQHITHIIQLTDGRLVSASINNSSKTNTVLEVWDLNPSENKDFSVTTLSASDDLAASDDANKWLNLSNTHSLIQLHDGRVLTSSDFSIMIWDLSRPEKNNCCVDSLTWSDRISCFVIEMDNGQLLATHGNTLNIWDITKPKDWRYVAMLEGHTKSISSIIQLFDGRLVSAAKDYSLKIWDPGLPEGKRCVSTLSHDKLITTLILLADGRLLSASSFDHTLKIWDPNQPENKCLVGTFDNEGNSIASVIQLNNGSLAIGSSERLKILNLYHAPESDKEQKKKKRPKSW